MRQDREVNSRYPDSHYADIMHSGHDFASTSFIMHPQGSHQYNSIETKGLQVVESSEASSLPQGLGVWGANHPFYLTTSYSLLGGKS